MTYLDRVLADAADRPAWELARATVLGASDAANFSKLESVDKYVLSKLKSGNWGGNSFTAAGHTWEPRMLAWFPEIEPNTLLVHSVNKPGFAATPDGWSLSDDGRMRLAECKLKHHPIKGPTLGERRQIVWAQYCWDASETDFIWQECDEDGAPTHLEPHMLVIPRDEALLHSVLTIGHQVLAKLRAAIAFRAELDAA